MSIGDPLHPSYWSIDSPNPDWKGPELYLLSNSGGPFGTFQRELYWTLTIYIKLHQHAHASFFQHERKLDELTTKLKADGGIELKDLEDSDYFMMMGRIRLMDYIFVEEIDLERSAKAINLMFVVAFWALAEQFLGKIFRKLVALETGKSVNSVKSPDKWDKFKLEYSKKGINLEALHDYHIADECRVLNNHIKHEPIISNRLAAFSLFRDHIGKPLDSMVLDPQRYLNGVSNFLGSLIETSNALHGYHYGQ